METLKVKVDGKEYKVEVEETDNGRLKVYFEDEVYEVETKEDINQLIDEELKQSSAKHEAGSVIKAPLPGKIVSVNVKKGQQVKENQLLIKLVAMKMENEITSPAEGKVKEIRVKNNDNVNKDDILMVLE